MKVRYLFVLAIMFAIVGVIGLRFNQSRVAELKQQVIAADRQGTGIEAALTELRSFVVAHMNTSTRVELAFSYERAAAEAKQTAEDNAEGEILSRAQAACDKPGVSSVEQAQCVRKYLQTHGQPGDNPQPVELPEKSQFVHAFVSPLWTPDLAGLSLLAALLSALGALGMYVRQVVRYFKTA